MAVTKIEVDTILPKTTKLKIIMSNENDNHWSFLPSCPVMGTVFKTTDSYFRVESGWDGGLFEGDAFVYREIDGVRTDMLFGWQKYSTCGIDNNSDCDASDIFTVDTSTWTLEQRTVTQVHQDLSMFGLEMQYEDIGETVIEEPTRTKVDNKLNVVIGTKAQIEGDADIPENSIIVVTDEELTADEIAYSVEKNVKEVIDDLEANKYTFINFYEGMSDFNIDTDCNDMTIYINVSNLGLGTFPPDYDDGGFLIQTRKFTDEYDVQTLFSPVEGKMYTREVLEYDEEDNSLWGEWKDHYGDKVALKVNTSDIVDNLTSTDTNKPLSANQGKVLNDNVALKVNTSDIVDNLTTNDATKVLSAKQGKVLNDNVALKVDKNANITAGKHPKITYDAKGLVTGGEALVPEDIPNLNASKINDGTFDVARIPDLAPTKITQNETNRFVTDVEKAYWDGKQDKLVAGENITINPDTNVISASGGGGNLNDYYTKTQTEAKIYEIMLGSLEEEF